MSDKITRVDMDVFIARAGSCGGTLTKELSRKRNKVILIERGDDRSLLPGQATRSVNSCTGQASYQTH